MFLNLFPHLNFVQIESNGQTGRQTKVKQKSVEVVVCTWIVIIYTEVFRRALLRLERSMHFRFASKWESVRSAAKEHQSVLPFIHLAEIHPMGKKFDDWDREKEFGIVGKWSKRVNF